MTLSIFHQHLQFSRSFIKKLNEELVSVGLYHSQWSIVYYLKQFGASTLVEISQYMDVEKPTITRTVNRLAEMELIEKVPSPDKRERKIQLSEKGQVTYQAAIMVVEKFESQLLEEIPKADLEATLRTVQRLKEKLKK